MLGPPKTERVMGGPEACTDKSIGPNRRFPQDRRQTIAEYNWPRKTSKFCCLSRPLRAESFGITDSSRSGQWGYRAPITRAHPLVLGVVVRAIDTNAWRLTILLFESSPLWPPESSPLLEMSAGKPNRRVDSGSKRFAEPADRIVNDLRHRGRQTCAIGSNRQIGV